MIIGTVSQRDGASALRFRSGQASGLDRVLRGLVWDVQAAEHSPVHRAGLRTRPQRWGVARAFAPLYWFSRLRFRCRCGRRRRSEGGQRDAGQAGGGAGVPGPLGRVSLTGIRRGWTRLRCGAKTGVASALAR